MKLAVSSLAWDPDQDAEIRALLTRLNVRGVELAPLKYWPTAPAVNRAHVRRYATTWNDAGIEVVAMQAVLFGRPDLQLFGTPEQATAFEQHLSDMCEVARALGAGVIVLGAPMNRIRGDLSETDAVARAAPVMRRIGARAVDNGCRVCIEPNPARYGGDFVRTSSEALELVRATDHPGFALHVDSGALTIVAEPDASVRAAARAAAHYHISEVDLVPVGAGTCDHARLGSLLRDAGYARWVSIEMRALPAAQTPSAIEAAVRVAQTHYSR